MADRTKSSELDWGNKHAMPQSSVRRTYSNHGADCNQRDLEMPRMR